ncbi:2-deoxy-D-gluconate 3-dehydrogenase [Caldicellulosiruptor acetigenus I77R1B]|uniref:2-dehydro-3-deoxy-D-gluconate 5-dehydrogenase n=2 Tax=Caldicellulosiruptor acetigenus TaxID=301953 RepID=G2PXM4_9FIRM|nr:2-dehydro-3-deoxy-D-gluconate 5-dehydrogenase KduD [Caldicellulosiruptor acetigenus]ADQ41453.1 2-deoxy-D-gluconate 3-dehydrogenase [Caldicellulosiruptor acetigenus I77R1B]AEM72743.1 2-deoxy-D-gluconate 3-dehydrogenase [Caldicellulosiruptor acetigenus 6A]AEM73044.1 2-deoxy-D-gluconate 3-dehydrogenase [Caldicellulosiruptor acetigenus 6A]WAM36394.1 2-dehydro-3-deoxy-D-gluconate 5-dehydrogenase KduD [Caldicellulosiruptor acetigenus]
MILDKFRLDGKVAIVTGASTGLGQGMAIALAEAGADIVGVDYVPCTETKQKIESIGRRFLEIQANLMTIEPINMIIEKTIQEFGKLDILVNNAGIIRRCDAIDFTEKDWDDVLAINLKTVFFFCQAAARQFIKQGTGGKIINIASMLSFQGGIRVPSYTASKSGVAGITRALANEWAKYNINVNAIAPGYMATNNTQPLREDPQRSAEILSRIPAGRWGTPEDLQGAVVFLASDASEYVNGCILNVDGGWLAR